MTGHDGLVELLRSYGLLLLFPLVVVEGPITTVIAAWLARRHQMELAWVALVCVVADVVGDVGYYVIGRTGRFMSARLRVRLDGGGPRFARIGRQFALHPGRTLLIGKFTYSVGLGVILTAGALRMPLPTFVGYSLLGTVPKTLLLLAVGWWIGTAWRTLDAWLGWGSLGLMALAGGTWWMVRWSRRRYRERYGSGPRSNR